MEGILYDGAGNLFLMVDGRDLPGELESSQVVLACESVPGTLPDGLIVVGNPISEGTDFSMHYYNRDGSGGMMCGNGGRCAVSFARDLGIPSAAPDGIYRFTAAGNLYTGRILEDNGSDKIVKLQIADVMVARREQDPDGWFLDTGCRHFVTFVGSEDELESLDLEVVGPALRNHPAFLPIGVNVNFVAPGSDGYVIRTFERGVEAETLACGTGIVSSSISLALADGLTGTHHFDFHARGGDLSVDLVIPEKRGENAPVATSIFLTGPTRRH